VIGKASISPLIRDEGAKLQIYSGVGIRVVF